MELTTTKTFLLSLSAMNRRGYLLFKTSDFIGYNHFIGQTCSDVDILYLRFDWSATLAVVHNYECR